MRTLFFIVITFCFTTAYSQENPPQASGVASEFENLSASELLKKAKSLSTTDKKNSTRFAHEALRLSEANNNQRVSSQAHNLLAKVNKKSKNIEQALHHFLQASIIYKELNDNRNLIMASINYVDILLDEKRYEDVDQYINKLLPIALDYGNEYLIARTLIIRGDSYYKQKRYVDANVQYDSAVKYLSDDDRDVQTRLAETYKKIAQSYKRIKDKEKIAYFYKKALDIYTDLHDLKSMARTLNSLSEAERHLGNYVVALDYSIRSLAIYKQVDDPIGRAKAQMGAGIIYRTIGRYEKSLKHIYDAHLYYKKINDVHAIANTSNQMGLIYTRLKQFEEAKSFYQLTIDLPKEKIEEKTIAVALREMAVIDLESGDYESAMVFAQKAYKIYQKKKFKSNQGITARIIGNIYREKKDDTQAIAYYRQSLALAKERGNKHHQIKVQKNLASILVGKNTDEAISLLKNSLVLSDEINDKPQRLYAFNILREAEKLRGNIAESLHYAEKEISLAEVIQREREENELVRTKANLHSHKMEIELESLREKARLDQLELAKKNNEIEIAEQTRIITELKFIKNQYANITLALLLAISVLFVIFIYRRFIASKKRNKELDYLATHDPLTNCYNRRVLFDQMDKDFEQADLLDEYCIIMADIDHFKAVNDTYGHNTGDKVLSGVANILQGCVRQNDIVARYGGEEFCIVLHLVTQEQAIHISDIMRRKVENSRFEDMRVTCSFGVTSIRFKAMSPTELIEQADIALYKSKSLGRNQVTLWNKSFKKLS